MRIVFMGTPDFAVPALRALYAAGHEIVGVYTQPPRPAGRGHRLQKSAVHMAAEELGLTVFTPINFKAEEDRVILRALQAEIGIVAAYGLILPQAVLDIPPQGFLNIHGSLLPRWRGAAPIHRAMLAGDAETGITIMRMEAGLDTGPMLAKESTSIMPMDQFQSVHDRLKDIGARLIVQALEHKPQETAQPDEGVTYAHKIAKNESLLQGNENAQKIELMTRVYGSVKLVDIKIVRCSICTKKTDQTFGVFLNRNGDMACAGGTVLSVDKIQTRNGKIMSVADAMNGGMIPCVSN